MKFKKFKFKKVKSTNDTAIRIIKKTNYKQGMVISKTQTNGKGQYGRKWISCKGNLFVSFFYELNNIKISISNITKYNCLLIKKLISNYTNKKIDFKKPNDLFIEKKKICGILQEVFFKSNSKFLITGIGINIKKSPNIKNYPTINLNDLSKKNIKLSEVENSLKKIFENNLFQLSKNKGYN